MLLVVGVEERDGVGFASGEEVSVAVDRDGDRGVAHKLADFVDRDPGVEHLRDGGVATLLQPDRADPLSWQAGFLAVFSFASGGPRLADTLVD